LRRARGFTQIQLAKAMGSTQRAISYYETEADPPSGAALIALARVLRLTTDELLGLKSVKLDRQDPHEQRLWRRFRRVTSLPQRDQRAVVRLITSLVSSKGQTRAAA
jgi:transcriptional regulator with XRE-family HTH domain